MQFAQFRDKLECLSLEDTSLAWCWQMIIIEEPCVFHLVGCKLLQ
jgi:hypothetical protein